MLLYLKMNVLKLNYSKKKTNNQFDEVNFEKKLVSLSLGMSIFKQPQLQDGILPSIYILYLLIDHLDI